MNAELKAFLVEARRRFEAFSPEQRAAHIRAQRDSFIRAMTTPCDHGVLDFETCKDCRALSAAR